METTRKRIEYLDIAKGIGILLVVWFHARGPYLRYIMHFHMPFFFLISGYLYNAGAGLGHFIRRKVTSLYIPFVFWNLFFYLLRRHGELFTNPASFRRHILLIVTTLDKDGAFCGATWFLGSLFLMSILYKLIDTLLPAFAAKRLVLLAVFTVISGVGFYYDFPYRFSRTLILGIFFAIGACVKEYKDRLSLFARPVTTVLFAAGFILIANHTDVNMGSHVYSNPLLFVPEACMASFVVVRLSILLEKAANRFAAVRPCKNAFLYMGKKSLDIVIWQFVFFGVPSMCRMILDSQPLLLNDVMAYYRVGDPTHLWWIAYVIAGTALPLAWCAFLRSGPWGRIFTKIHIV
ncbi:MAG: acyltransferase family protein [Blautia sp.]|nr:acyltransferase family protein [Blautia sp.]